MKRTLKHSLLLVGLLFLGACHKHKSTHHKIFHVKKSKAELEGISQILTPEALANYESWINSPLKTCGVEAVFTVKSVGSQSPSPVGLDLGLINAQNQGSNIFTLGAEAFRNTTFLKIKTAAQDKIEDKGRTLEVNLEDSRCIVKINGKTLSTTLLVQKLTIDLQWSTELIPDHNFLDAVTPTDEAIVRFGSILHLSPEDAPRFIKIGKPVGPVLYRGPENNDWSLLDEQTQLPSGKIELLIRSGSQKNTLFTYQTEPQQLLNYGGTRPVDPIEAQDCLRLRVNSSYVKALEFCQNLDPNLAEVPSLLSELAVRRFNQYEAVKGSNDGWKEILKKLIEEKRQQGLSLASLDPESKTQIIPLISQNDELIRAAIAADKNLAELEVDLNDLGIELAFVDPQGSRRSLSDFLKAASQFRQPFRTSIHQMMKELKLNLTVAKDSLAFALSIPDPELYKARALDGRVLAAKFPYDHFMELFFDQMFQKKVTLSDLNRIIEEMKTKVSP